MKKIRKNYNIALIESAGYPAEFIRHVVALKNRKGAINCVQF
jgi:hypothetical protein